MNNLLIETIKILIKYANIFTRCGNIFPSFQDFEKSCKWELHTIWRHWLYQMIGDLRSIWVHGSWTDVYVIAFS